MDLRQHLLQARTEDEFKQILLKHTQELAEEQAMPSVRVDQGSPERLSREADNNNVSNAFLFYYFPFIRLLINLKQIKQ